MSLKNELKLIDLIEDYGEIFIVKDNPNIRLSKIIDFRFGGFTVLSTDNLISYLFIKETEDGRKYYHSGKVTIEFLNSKNGKEYFLKMYEDLKPPLE